MRERLIGTIAFSALLLALIFQAPSRKGYGSQLSYHEMCTEVAAALQEAVESGVISQADADQISHRCFDTQEHHD